MLLKSVKDQTRKDCRVASISALGLALLLAGCSGDSPTPTTPAASSSSTTSSIPQSTSKALNSKPVESTESTEPAKATESATVSEESKSGDQPLASAPDTAPATDAVVAAKPAETPVANSGTASSPTGVLTGTITFNGDAPTLAALVKSDDEAVKDREVCAVADVPDESLLVDESSKGLANVFVFMRRAPKGFKSVVPEDAAVLDQKACRFLPHASAVQVGQVLKILSDDAVQHNIHSFPNRNQGVNVLITPNDRKGLEVRYSTAEAEPFQIKCDIHSWMASYQIALDHPFVAISDAQGTFRIEKLPPGTHEFRIWHEKASFLEKKLEVEIKAGEATELNLNFAAERFAGVARDLKTIVVSAQ